jgi:hypothetical protein
MAPILDATLPRLPSSPPELLLFFCRYPPKPLPPFRSGLVEGPLREVRASRILPTGDGDRFDDTGSVATRRLVVSSCGMDSEEASVLYGRGEVEVRGSS